MNDLFPDNLLIWTGGIFFIWSIALIWGSWQLRRTAAELAQEQHEMRRWKRFTQLRDTQQRKWN